MPNKTDVYFTRNYIRTYSASALQDCISRKITPIKPACIIFMKISLALKTVLTEQQLAIIMQRLSHQILENHLDLANTVLIGIQPRGIYVSDRIVAQLKQQIDNSKISYGKLDITFYRDDVRKELHIANKTDIPFNIENKNVVLIDDVLYTGRTIRAALDALLDFGRPAKVELCILIDRRFSRQLPIQADYIGKSIDSIITQKVRVFWKEKDGQEQVGLLE
jgi:pyrimidine operon attenuation protein / uracil phosphoribosyltransferase